MEDKTNLRAPVSQQSHVVPIPEHPEHIGGSVSVEINEKKFSVPLGTTILEACRGNQIHIPTLCHHDDLCVAGVCRVCVVEVEGMRTLQASCSYPITNPIKIKTADSTANNFRADGNTVDLDRTMGSLAENTLLYKTAAQIISQKFSGLKNVIKGGSN